ncbi:MAG: hypothetical protein JRN15_23750, partial [Nitrososphaerota archaeon]|nr:hypothetical protein [Nitrososphaerota archaeon]
MPNTHRLIILLGSSGVLAIIGLGVTGDTTSGSVFAGLAVALLATAVTIGVGGLVAERRTQTAVSLVPSSPGDRAGHLNDGWVAGLVALATGVAVQTWFATGTVIAGGDIAPPEGTAWIGRLFASWVSTYNLGGPGAQEVQLPWAAVLWTVRSFGGSAGLAQRLWYTILVVGAMLAAYALLRLLRLSQVSAAIGALIYMFNPNSFGTDIYPVDLAAMLLLVGLPVCVLAAATHRWSFTRSIVLIALSAPLLGYTYQNPPLTGIIGLAFVGSIAIAWAMDGRAARRDATKVVAGGGILLLVTSAYWLVPSLAQLQNFASASYVPLSGWLWEEGRATLANGLWLNMNIFWGQAGFFPYANRYAILPLSLVKFVLPAAAFLAVPLTYWRHAHEHSARKRLVLGSAGLALFLVLLGTGTRLPGSIIFDPLYHLPLGWLIREPFRFLMVAGL